MSKSHFLRRNWKLIVNILTVAALAGLTYAVRHQIADTINNLGKVNAWALILMIPIEALNYNAYARMYRSMFRILGTITKYWEMYKVTLELNLINHLFPSGGVSGFSYFSVRMKRLGASTAQSTLVQTMRFIFLFLSFEILLVLGLFMLAIGGQANQVVLLVAGVVATLAVVATAGLAFIVGSKKRINSFFTFATKAVNRLIQVFRPQHPETINIERAQYVFTELHENYLVLKNDYGQMKGPFLNGLVANLTELAALYVVYIAFGHWVNPGAIILAYAIANFAGLISVLPGGIGIYEAIMTAVLVAAGVPAAVSIPVTVMYRVLNMAIQIVPGYYFYHKNVNEVADEQHSE